MHYTRKKFGFKHLIIYFEDELFLQAIKEKKYPQVTLISYKKHIVPNVSVKEKTTGLIDLSGSPDDILSRMNDTTRNEIRRTFRNQDIICKEISGFDESVYKTYCDFERSQKRIPIKKDEFGLYRYFCCYHKDQLLSVVSVVEAKPHLRVRSIFSLRLSVEHKAQNTNSPEQEKDRELMKLISNASRRIMYETCLWGHKNGFNSLDLASINFNNPETANITKFKMSFGCNIQSEYTHTYVSGLARLYPLWSKLRKIF